MPRPPVTAPLFPGHPGISWLCTRPERRGGASAECSILPSPRRPTVRLPPVCGHWRSCWVKPKVLLSFCDPVRKARMTFPRCIIRDFFPPVKGKVPCSFPSRAPVLRSICQKHCKGLSWQAPPHGGKAGGRCDGGSPRYGTSPHSVYPLCPCPDSPCLSAPPLLYYS